MIKLIFKKYKHLFKHYPLIKRPGVLLKKSLTGFTLLELMVSVVILSFLTLCIFAILNIGDMSWRTDMGLLDIHQQARQAMPGMIRELRQSVNNSTNPVNITNGGAKINFYIYNVSKSISYYVQGDKMIREHPPGTTRVLATNIQSVNFCCQQGTNCNTTCTNSDVVEVRITAGKTVKFRDILFNLTERVKLRNE